MSYVVYWIQPSSSEFFPNMEEPRAQMFTDEQMSEALAFIETKRKEPGVHHVDLCSENSNSVGKPGVDSIVDGKTPDGHEYTWMKRRSQ